MLSKSNSWQQSRMRKPTTDPSAVKEQETILIADDDVVTAQQVGEYLVQYNYRVDYEYDSARVVRRVLEERPSLVLLDLLMPGSDGLRMCRELREEFFNPIIVLTGLEEEADIIMGLEMGANAYLIKPIKPRILLAHVRAHLRHGLVKRYSVQSELEIRCGDIEINLKKRAVFNADKEVELTNAEYDLLVYLAHRSGVVVPRCEIYKNLRKLEYNGVDRGIDLRISRLRKKLGDDPKCPQLIKTVRGVGYLFAG